LAGAYYNWGEELKKETQERLEKAVSDSSNDGEGEE
jgi:hypothetical protein